MDILFGRVYSLSYKRFLVRLLSVLVPLEAPRKKNIEKQKKKAIFNAARPILFVLFFLLFLQLKV